VRPLLTLRKAEIVQALRKSGASWREDASNVGSDHFRNRVRLRVLPAWQRAAERDALAGAARSRELLEEDDSALEAWLAELRPLSARGVLDLRKLEGKPRGLIRRALHQWVGKQAVEIRVSRQAFDALLDAVCAGRETRQSMGVDGFAVLAAGRLCFRRLGKNTRRFQTRPN
jgi:tRNA(Ile)-lysidine synthase